LAGSERYGLLTTAKNSGQFSNVTFWNRASDSPITEVSYLFSSPPVSNLSRNMVFVATAVSSSKVPITPPGESPMTLRWPLLSFTLALGLAVPQILAQNSNADSELKLGIAAYGKANLAQVEEGMSLLTRAAGIVESYDVKAYLSLLYRERADIQCGDLSAYDQDVNAAMEWTRRACDALHEPDRGPISCVSWRCPPPTPPPAGPGKPGGCSD
jgi:hypothetical protein